MDQLLAKGDSLSAYRSNPAWPVGPVAGSWAWKFERAAEKALNVRHVIACANGTLALIAALRALDLPPGEIVTTPYTFSATAAAIRFAGHEPVFADVEPETFCLDPESVAGVIGPRTRALLPVDLFGALADYEGLKRFGLPIVEDAAQAVGAGLTACRGEIAMVSFNGGKQLPAGEAGAVATNSHELAERARRFVSHGENFFDVSVGLNARLNEPTALIAWHGLKKLSTRNARRRTLARILVSELRGQAAIRTLPDPVGHALYVFPLVLHASVDRARFAERLKQAGVEVGCGYLTPPISSYPAFKDCRRAPLPVVTELSECSLCLFSQVRPPATEADMRWLANAIREALR
jgi:dTDP-4-amino-4,6-dideoxygalactose transaminase